MIPFFNIPDIFNFPQHVRNSYEIRREHATDNGNYRNSLFVVPLEQSLANLNKIETLIESRMDKDAASGTDMTDAGLLLVIAQQSLANAVNAVGEATSTGSGGLHPAFVNAHFALNDAKDALNTVVDAIATAENE